LVNDDHILTPFEKFKKTPAYTKILIDQKKKGKVIPAQQKEPSDANVNDEINSDFDKPST